MNIEQMCQEANERIRLSIRQQATIAAVDTTRDFHRARILLGLSRPAVQVEVPKMREPLRGGPGGAVKFHNVGAHIGSGHFDNSYTLYHVSVGGGGGGGDSGSCSSGD